jgi:hypothetical protein
MPTHGQEQEQDTKEAQQRSHQKRREPQKFDKETPKGRERPNAASLKGQVTAKRSQPEQDPVRIHTKDEL